jgi:NAD(P)H-hydrate epimerase
MATPVITIAQMREWERATWASGQTEAEVIARVGKCVARHGLRLTASGDTILILAGAGHNGDDALRAREHLIDRKVEILQVTNPSADLPKLDRLLAQGPGLIIDGLFGIGINRPLSAEWVQFIERVNSKRKRVLAVDVPSGLDADTGQPHGTAICATVTLTVGAPKIGLLQESASPFVGRLEVAGQVGLVPCPLSSEIQWSDPADFAGFPPPRAATSHKGTYGHLGIIAGSPGYHGAAVLAARGAQRAQPGLITLHALDSVYHPIAAQLQAVMVAPWQVGNKLVSGCNTVLIGPGLAGTAQTDQMRLLVRHLWRDSNLTVVVDASALDWLPQQPAARNTVRVITPHPGEAARLLRTNAAHIQANRLESLRAISKAFGDTWVVLKGNQTMIGRSSGEVYVNPSGNPHLAQGGSGDALAGFIAGLLTQPRLLDDPLKTLRYAVWQHGAAADYLDTTRPNWIVEELLDELGGHPPETAEGA